MLIFSLLTIISAFSPLKLRRTMPFRKSGVLRRPLRFSNRPHYLNLQQGYDEEEFFPSVRQPFRGQKRPFSNLQQGYDEEEFFPSVRQPFRGQKRPFSNIQQGYDEEEFFPSVRQPFGMQRRHVPMRRSPRRQPMMRRLYASNPRGMFVPDRMFSSRNRPVTRRYGNRPSIYAGVIVPDPQVALNVILAAQTAINVGVDSILNDLNASIDVLIDNANTTEIPLIVPIIEQGNTDMYNGIDSIINGLSGYVDQLVEETSQAEHGLASNSLSIKNTQLVNEIKALITTLQIAVSDALTAHSATELTDLTTTIEAANYSLFTQLSTILNDPNNNAPALPQLTFPDPAAIAESIAPGKEALYQEISALLTTFVNDSSALIAANDLREKNEVTVIMNDGTADLITKLENITNGLLQDVQTLIDNVTQQESTAITNAITPIQNTLKTNIDAEMATISTKVNDLINQVTTTELADMSNALTDYNQNIAGGLINNLTV
ncbi:hypothetical protein M153_100043863 [Pseudoloma neurophilia]|uniref:Uncharacterized protein n=1 Tax=Pseudoloma neurophilia TaxID=146866 RepID=A0A0R0M1H6_9MICR|nr:hypothetical protein M153_100043863 [Pseudoloma neurophilia]